MIGFKVSRYKRGALDDRLRLLKLTIVNWQKPDQVIILNGLAFLQRKPGQIIMIAHNDFTRKQGGWRDQGLLQVGV